MAKKQKSVLGTILILLALAPFKFAIAQAPLALGMAVLAALIGFWFLFDSYKDDKKDGSVEEAE